MELVNFRNREDCSNLLVGADHLTAIGCIIRAFVLVNQDSVFVEAAIAVTVKLSGSVESTNIKSYVLEAVSAT